MEHHYYGQNRRPHNSKAAKHEHEAVDKTKVTFDEMKQPDVDRMKRQQFNNWNRLKEIVENGSPDKQLDESLV